jgi:hypothetical protein
MNTSTLFMAFAKGQESKETVFKRYIGVAPVSILALNPTRDQMMEILGSAPEEEPVYVGETDRNGEKITQVRLTFLVKTEAAKCNGIEAIMPLTLFIANAWDVTNDGQKVFMVNKYGENACIPIEDAEKGVLPDNIAQWFSTEGMRKAYRGERALVDMLKRFLVIPNRTYQDRKSGARVQIKNLEDAEALLTKIPDYFKGDVSEIKEIIASQPNNKIKVAVGVRTTDDNRQYQDIFTRLILGYRVNDFSKLDAEIKNAQSNGAYPKTEFSIEPLHEYEVEATPMVPATPAEPAAAPSSWFQAAE